MFRKRLTVIAITVAAGFAGASAAAPVASAANGCKPLSYFPSWHLCEFADKSYLCAYDTSGKVVCWRSEPAPRDPEREIAGQAPDAEATAAVRTGRHIIYS